MEQRQLQEMKSGLVGDQYLQDPKRKALVERWNKWIPTSVKGAHNRFVLATLFENQLGDLKSFKEKHMLGEDTSTANTAPFIKYTFPLLRRVWPNLIAPEIVSVQPMTSPVGAIFYFELKYGSSKGQVQSGQKLVKDFNRYYSSELVDGEAGLGSGSGTAVAKTLAYVPVKAGTLKIVSSAVSGQIIDDGAGNLIGSGALAISGGTINYATGALSATLSSAQDRSALTVTYQYNLEANSQVPTVDIDISLVSVTARSRKIKALWSSEAADDLKALHGVDAEQELVAGVGSELALEIDREIIEDLRVGAAGPQANFDMTVPSGLRQVDHIRSIVTPMTLISNMIGKNSLRGPANFAVMSYDLAAYVEQLGTDGFLRPIFAGNGNALEAAEAPQTWGVMKMGTLQQRWTVYKDPYLKSDDMIIGYKGQSFVDAGYVWAPYVPLQTTSTFLDPNDFKMRKGLRTRYAKLMARGEFYGKLKAQNLGTLANAGSFGPAVLPF